MEPNIANDSTQQHDGDLPQECAAKENYIASILGASTREIISHQALGTIEAILVSGSLGRNEGSVQADAMGHQRLLNDIDILIISSRFDRASISHIANHIKNTHALDFADIGHLKKAALRTLPLSMYSYDLKYGSRVIHGNATIQDLLPTYAAGKLPLNEGLKLILNRYAGYLIARNHENTSQQTRINQVAKLLIALGDYKTIEAGQYSSSYEKRWSLLPQAKLDVAVKIAVSKAYDYKLNPTVNKGARLLATFEEMPELVNSFFTEHLIPLMPPPGSSYFRPSFKALTKLGIHSIKVRRSLMSQQHIYAALIDLIKTQQTSCDDPLVETTLKSWEIACH